MDEVCQSCLGKTCPGRSLEVGHDARMQVVVARVGQGIGYEIRLDLGSVLGRDTWKDSSD